MERSGAEARRFVNNPAARAERRKSSWRALADPRLRRPHFPRALAATSASSAPVRPTRCVCLRAPQLVFDERGPVRRLRFSLVRRYVVYCTKQIQVLMSKQVSLCTVH